MKFVFTFRTRKKVPGATAVVLECHIVFLELSIWLVIHFVGLVYQHM